MLVLKKEEFLKLTHKIFETNILVQFHHFVVNWDVVGRVSLKTQNIFLRPGDLIPTVFRYEDTKKTISNV